VAVVQRPAFDARPTIGTRDRHGSGFQLQYGRDAVESLEPMSTHGLRVAVQIDESRCDDTTRGIEDEAPTEVGSDGGDAGIIDREIYGHVELLAGIDPTSPADHQGKLDRAVGLWWSRAREGTAGKTGGRTPEQETPPI